LYGHRLVVPVLIVIYLAKFLVSSTSTSQLAIARLPSSHVTIVENTFEFEQVAPVIEAPVVEVIAEQVAVKTEQGTVTVDILAAATVEQVAEQVATDAYTAGCDAKYFAKTHAARIAKAAGTALTTEVKHLITTVTRRTVDTLDTALMA